MSNKKFVTYLEFGAVGDGVTNDFAAIKKAHDYANEHNIPVKIEGDNTYYIGDVEIDGTPEVVVVKTDVDWGNATFIIDDNVFPLSGISAHGKHYMHIFEVRSEYEPFKITDREILDRIVAEGFNKKTTKINLGLGYPVMIVTDNPKQRVYKRKGYGGHDGYPMWEVIVLDKDGIVNEETSVMFDYCYLDHLDVFRIDDVPLTLKNGTFITLANNENTVLYDENGKVRGFRDLYFKRGISVRRSFTTVKDIVHKVEGEITPAEQVKGKMGVGYYGFFTSNLTTNVTFENCIMAARRCYGRNVSGVGGGGAQGTYDLHCDRTNKTVFRNCIQSNFWVDGEGNAVSKDAPGARFAWEPADAFPIVAPTFWDIGGSNDCKNIEYIGCTLSRYDAHRGLYNGKIIDTTINCISLVGGGNMVIDNVTWYSNGLRSVENSLVFLRGDYGCTWNGNITIRNMKAYPKLEAPTNIIHCAYVNWDFGYPATIPNITIENIKYYDYATGEQLPAGFSARLFENERCIKIDAALHLPETLNTHPWYDDENWENFNGIQDTESFKNVNQVVAPEYLKIVGNEAGYVFSIPDTYSYKGLGDKGFLEKTKFYYTDTEYYEGTNHTDEDTRTFKFTPVE